MPLRHKEHKCVTVYLTGSGTISTYPEWLEIADFKKRRNQFEIVVKSLARFNKKIKVKELLKLLLVIEIGPFQLGSRDQNSPKNIICYGL